MIATEIRNKKCNTKKIFTCITFSSNKLGPRLVGNAEDWGLNEFSKEVLYDIIHDSLLIRSSTSLLFIKNEFGEIYRVYILKYNRIIQDYFYDGSSFSYCIFVPNNYPGVVHIDKSIENFEWIEYSDSISLLVQELRKKILE